MRQRQSSAGRPRCRSEVNDGPMILLFLKTIWSEEFANFRTKSKSNGPSRFKSASRRNLRVL